MTTIAQNGELLKQLTDLLKAHRRYWNWRRRGRRGGEGYWRYGGKFDELSRERQEQYWQRTQKCG